MIAHIVILFALCNTSSLSINLHEDVQTANKTDVSKDKTTNLRVAGEGGTILLSNKLDTTLPKDNFNSLASLDEELHKTKQKSVVPRKGVDNMMPPDIAPDLKPQTGPGNITSTEEKVNNTLGNTPNISPKKMVSNSTSTVKQAETKPVEVKKKPLILSYDALANAASEQSKTVAPSVKTMANSQIPSPNEQTVPKVYPSKANSHPGMIMPIVITILVVPMFAIVGYMALKRGQEAWKNRHYKRMDFLLDGMYND